VGEKLVVKNAFTSSSVYDLAMITTIFVTAVFSPHWTLVAFELGVKQFFCSSEYNSP